MPVYNEGANIAAFCRALKKAPPGYELLICYDFEGDDTNISRSLHASLVEGFMEDKAIIEAQQRTLDADPDFRMVPIASDGPLTHFRRVMDELIAAERAPRDEAPAMRDAAATGQPVRVHELG